MTYTCTRCGATYSHDKSYDHNLYKCPVLGKKGTHEVAPGSPHPVNQSTARGL